MTVRYLSSAEIQGIHDMIMDAAGTTAELLDEGKLEGAAMRPQNAAHYEHASLSAQAAVLIAGIAIAHAYSDGNKRLALNAGDTFLMLNGVHIQAENREYAQQILDLIIRDDTLPLATNRLTAWLDAHSTNLPTIPS